MKRSNVFWLGGEARSRGEASVLLLFGLHLCLSRKSDKPEVRNSTVLILQGLHEVVHVFCLGQAIPHLSDLPRKKVTTVPRSRDIEEPTEPWKHSKWDATTSGSNLDSSRRFATTATDLRHQGPIWTTAKQRARECLQMMRQSQTALTSPPRSRKSQVAGHLL